jgi:hypothetical protein
MSSPLRVRHRALFLDGDVVIYTPVIGKPVRLADGAKVSLGGGGPNA